jgi:hypothetical protein
MKLAETDVRAFCLQTVDFGIMGMVCSPHRPAPDLNLQINCMRLSSNSMLAALASNHLSWCHSVKEPTARAGFPVVFYNRILAVFDSNLGRDFRYLSFSGFTRPSNQMQ